jgi:hypothetical protein
MTARQIATVRAEFLKLLSEESQSCLVLTLLAIKDDIHRLDLAGIQDHVEELLAATTEEED